MNPQTQKYLMYGGIAAIFLFARKKSTAPATQGAAIALAVSDESVSAQVAVGVPLEIAQENQEKDLAVQLAATIPRDAIKVEGVGAVFVSDLSHRMINDPKGNETLVHICAAIHALDPSMLDSLPIETMPGVTYADFLATAGTTGKFPLAQEFASEKDYTKKMSRGITLLFAGSTLGPRKFVYEAVVPVYSILKNAGFPKDVLDSAYGALQQYAEGYTNDLTLGAPAVRLREFAIAKANGVAKGPEAWRSAAKSLLHALSQGQAIKVQAGAPLPLPMTVIENAAKDVVEASRKTVSRHVYDNMMNNAKRAAPLSETAAQKAAREAAAEQKALSAAKAAGEKAAKEAEADLAAKLVRRLKTL